MSDMLSDMAFFMRLHVKGTHSTSFLLFIGRTCLSPYGVIFKYSISYILLFSHACGYE